MIKAVIFDCFGVLTTDTWKAFCATLPPDALAEAKGLNKQRDMGLLPPEEFTKAIIGLTGKQPQSVEKLLKNEVVKNEALLDYIRDLRNKGYKIGMISNIASDWIREEFLTTEEQELFDEMIFSFEVGMTKPDPRIFMLACERLRVGTHEAVMIDDIESYCQAAEKEGLKGIVYRDLEQLKSELEPILSIS